MRVNLSLVLMAAALAFAAPALPAPRSEKQAAPPLFEGLGSHTRKVQARHAEAQKYFDQGLNFLFAFNHDEAIRAFQHAAALDPECAMAHWGVAMANGMHINKPTVEPERARAAHEAMKRAERFAPRVKDGDLALLAAIAVRYPDAVVTDQRKLDEAYSKAMKTAWEKHPKDADIGALYAESLMNLRPWDLWTGDSKPQPETPEIIATLDAVLELNAKHPLALHLYIHALEASPNPDRADAAADRLRNLMPSLGHMVHMPSHIDVRRGRWQTAIESNQRAITADAKYAKTVPEQGFYRLYMAHNHHMLAFAAMMQGESKRALDSVREMLGGVPKEWVVKPENAAIADGFVAAPLEVMKRFGKWDDILKEPEPPEIFPIARAMRHQIRAVAYAARGEVEKARAEQKVFRDSARKVKPEATFGNNKAADLFAIGEDMLEGEILVREGKMREGIAKLRAAIEKEDKLRYGEPPDWVVPVRHALGAFLLKDGQAAEAEAVYREDLRRWPDNGWSLFGLAASLEAQGKKAEAAKVRAKFDEVWKHADVKLPSSCFCQVGCR